MLETPRFHHLHLNTWDANAAICFYTTHFESCHATLWGGFPAVETSDNVLLVFTETHIRPLLQTSTAINHFGWQVRDSRECLASFLKNPRSRVLPLYTGDGNNTVFISSDTWPAGYGVNGLTLHQIEDAKAANLQPTRSAGFGFLQAPDGEIIEFQGRNPVERFNHIHMYQDDPYCALLWYQTHLNAPMYQDRGPKTPVTESTCKVLPGPDRTWPSLEKEGMLRSPRAGVKFGEVVLTWYPRQTDVALVSTRGHACDHIGLSVSDLDSWYKKLVSEGVTILEEEYTVADARAFMIEGPSLEAIELIEIG